MTVMNPSAILGHLHEAPILIMNQECSHPVLRSNLLIFRKTGELLFFNIPGKLECDSGVDHIEGTLPLEGRGLGAIFSSDTDWKIYLGENTGTPHHVMAGHAFPLSGLIMF